MAAAIDYPPSLPNPLASSIEERPIPSYVDDEAQAGDSRRRKVFSRTLIEFSFTQPLTDAEATILRTFRDTTTNGGVEPFNWTHPATLETYVVKFGKLPGPRRVVANEWRAELVLRET